MTIRINPAGFRSAHLHALNRAFPGWGDERRLRWCFERQSSPCPPDIVILEHDGAAVAGTGISYRRMRIARGTPMIVGILTAAWSFPTRSQQGAYRRVMAKAVRLIAERGGALAIGFMPQERSSGHQLLRDGAAALSTAYMVSSHLPHPTADVALRRCGVTNELRATLLDRINARSNEAAAFIYANDEFSEQFIARPHSVEILANDEDTYFIVERLPATVRLLSVLPAHGRPLSQRDFAMASEFAANDGKELLAYASSGRTIAAAAAAGLIARPAFTTLTITARPRETEDGDRAVSDSYLTLRDDFQVEDGDRM